VKYLFTILFFSLFAHDFLFAQSNFKKAFIVTSAGDTLKGFIDQQEWIRNPEVISFKPGLEEGKQEFTPENARYFECRKSVILQ